MPSIKDLYEVIKNADGDPDRWEGLAYGITYNDHLGLPDGGDFLVLSPFGKLPQDDGAFVKASEAYAEGLMPIQKTFKDVLVKGNKLSEGQKMLFIDIADLDDGNGNTVFFTEGGANSIAEAIADLVNNKVPSDVTPVIRFLRGTSAKVIDDNFWNSHQPGIEAIFWKATSDGKGLAPRITNANAQFHVGYYSPNLKLTHDQQEFFRVLATTFKDKSWTVAQVNATLDSAFSNLNFSASWNHGKIVAIGGKTMMTGGINYWPEYIGKDDSGRGRIIDMQATVTGDAAASAQRGYLDYFWKYLNLNAIDRQTDGRSFKKSISLTAKISPGHKLWQSDWKVPIFKDTVKFTPKTTGIPVLSVARVGDWGGRYIAAYPVQAVDGLRDIYVNSMIPGLEATANFGGIIDLIHKSSDKGPVGSILNWLRFSPAAWASDTSRIWAIQNAKSTVYTSGQMIVGALQRAEKSWDTVVAHVNEKLPEGQKWDGYLWPYDLLLAFATVVLRLRDANKDPATSGIYIVLGNTDTTRRGEWGDYRLIGDVRARIVPLLRGLDNKLTEAGALELLSKYLEIKRIRKPYGENGPDSIHTKTICVDRQLLYVGSDNLYPSYNEEHGIWVDHEPSVKGWISDFWDVLWAKATVATTADVNTVSK